MDVESKEEVGTISRRWASQSLATTDNQAEPEELQLQQQPPNGEEPFGGNSSLDDQLFGVQFSSNLEARHKVLLLSACFMMDFFYFENDRRRRKLASC